MSYKKVYTDAELFEKVEPSGVLSETSGGTANILPEERKKATFNPMDLTLILDGGQEAYKRKQFIRGPSKKFDHSNRYEMTRAELVADDLNHFIKIHKPYANFKTAREDIMFMGEVASVGGTSLANHHMLFSGTLAGQCNEDQYKEWYPKAMSFQIIGCYAQTELGHGSNVRGLETTATFDKNTQEFILNSPTITSRKWWPGALGKVATHAVVYAQLIIDGKQYGVHSFMCQIRDDNHKPLPGIELGDLGTKVGDGANDTGFMVMKNVRIPRQYMLAKYQHVESDGTYVKDAKVDKQIHYTTMMATRASMVATAGGRIAAACTISIRYSAVRKQGFLNTAAGVDYKTPERSIIDYQIQQYRLLKQLANSYAIKFTARWMLQKINDLEGGRVGHIKNTKDIKETAAASAGLKALCTKITVEGIEDCRKCCGGNGYLMNSGLAQFGCDYLWQITAEGDQMILTLLTARFLIKSIQDLQGRGKKQVGMMAYLNTLLEPDFSFKKYAPTPTNSQAAFEDIEYLKKLFEFKAMIKIAQTAISLQKKIKKEHLKFEEAWNRCAYDLMNAANSHGYYLLFNSFYTKIQEVKDQNIATVLKKVLALYACTNILDTDWGGVIHQSQFEFVRAATYDLMDQIRPNAIALVDAFDIPDNALNSTIGSYDGNVYEKLVNAARKSRLNRVDPFEGYNEYLRPHLNLEFLKQGNKWMPKSKL